MIRLMTVDDHPMLRQGIRAVVEEVADMTMVAEAGNGIEAISQFKIHRPDVVLMDLKMPEMDGVAATTAIRADFPTAVILALTTYEGDAQALSALKAGAQGYLLKSALRTELVDTIRALYRGKHFIPAEIATQIAVHASGDALSAREVAVLVHVAAGNSNRATADLLGIGEETVKGHMKSITAKLNARDRTHAVTIAIRRGIIVA